MNTERLFSLQRNLQIRHGKFDEEFHEQLMTATFLTGHEKVLEIGGNFGRNSLIIGSILKEKHNDVNFVVLESNPEYIEKLKENRDINNLHFYIENKALSKYPLFQKDWTTYSLENKVEGSKEIDIISWDELNDKYGIPFDTLVLDCEGAFYNILKEFPEILQNVNLVFMENDYTNPEHKKFVEETLFHEGFRIIFMEKGPVHIPMFNIPDFYVVWKRG